MAVLLSRLRYDEKLIFDALARRGVMYDRVDDRQAIFDLAKPARQYDSVLIRCISQSHGEMAAAAYGAAGTVTVNAFSTVACCNNKVLTTLALTRAGLPSPRTLMAFDTDSALSAVEQVGYPAVLKPPAGSWGRLLARANDRDAAEAIVEHKATLGSVAHSTFYIQEHVAKPQRDIRIIVIGGHAIAGMYRYSEHWITNAARGGKGVKYLLCGEAIPLAERAAAAVGGGAVAVDLLEGTDRLYVNEVNATMEFRECTEATGCDIAGALVDYWLEVANGN